MLQGYILQCVVYSGYTVAGSLERRLCTSSGSCFL